MDEVRELQLRKYSNGLLSGTKWVLVTIFISQLMQFFTLLIFDVTNDPAFQKAFWTANLDYVMRHIIWGSGVPLIAYICTLLCYKKWPKYHQWYASGIIAYFAIHYSFTHWGFNFLSIFNIFPVLLSCPYNKKVKTTHLVLALVSTVLYCAYQIYAKGFSPFHMFIVSINCAQIVMARIISDTISKVFNDLFTANITLNKDAYIDKLTGLFNKNAFLTQKARIIGKSIAFIDTDNFKQINDTYGHDMGDKILVAIAEEFKTIDNSSSYRFGGDEFIIISHNTGKILGEQLQTVVSRINEKCSNKYNIPVTFSIGVTLFVPGTPIDNILRKSDALLYEAKAAGKNNIYLDTVILK